MSAVMDSREKLKQLKELIQTCDIADEKQVETVLDEVATLRESELFCELGKLTRELHETLNNFQLDAQLSALAEHDIPDAKERLNYVIKMTEQSANRTLTAVEEALPLAEELHGRAATLQKDWSRFLQKRMPLDEFRTLSHDVDVFLAWTHQNSGRIRTDLSDILMAQDFQDLTGQIIRRVIMLVQDVESKLVDLIRISGQRIKPIGQASAVNHAEAIRAEGPQVPGLKQDNVVVGQDDVDDLLSSLGF